MKPASSPQLQNHRIVPPGLELRAYQKEGVRWLLNTRRALLADDMGLGKTPQTIVMLNQLDKNSLSASEPARRILAPTVIIAPTNMIGGWEQELHTWLIPEFKRPLTMQLISKGSAIVRPDTSLLLLTYGIARQKKWTIALQKFLRRHSDIWVPGILIVDEAHALRNWQTQQTKAVVRELATSAPRTVFISATPMDGNATHLHPVFSAIEPGKWGKFDEFGAKYSHRVPQPKHPRGFIWKGVKDEALLIAKSKHFILRRFKEDHLPELPEVIHSNVFIDVPSVANQIKELFGKVAEHPAASDPEAGFSLESLQIKEDDPHIAAERRRLGVEKVPSIIEFIKETRENLFARPKNTRTPSVTPVAPPSPIVVYAYHLDVLDALVKWARGEGIPCSFITGAVTGAARAQIVKEFQAGKYSLLFVQLKAGSEGITITRSNVCIMAELDWSGLTMNQAVGRVHRFGQQRGVLVYYLIAKGSLDQRVIGVLRAKMKAVEKVLGNPNSDTEEPRQTKKASQTKLPFGAAKPEETKKTVKTQPEKRIQSECPDEPISLEL